MLAKTFFDYLFNNGFCTPFVWENGNPQTTRYEVEFLCKRCKLPAIHRISINKSGLLFYVPNKQVSCFLKSHLL